MIFNTESAQDVTELLKTSAKFLGLGQLVKLEHFTLMQAMHAIDLMNPQMDLGVIISQISRPIYDLEKISREGLPKLDNLNTNDLIGIIDETYACIALWLDGHSPAQSTFTNLFLHKPDKVEDKFLSAFIFAILKVLDSINTMISEVSCHDEEDFIIHVEGGPLYDQLQFSKIMSDQSIISSLEKICTSLDGMITNKKQQTKKDKKTNLDQAEIPTYLHKETKAMLAHLLIRFKFTLNLTLGFTLIKKDLIRYRSNLNSLKYQQLSKALRTILNAKEACDKYFDIDPKLYKDWKESLNVGTRPMSSSNIEIKYDSHFEDPCMIGFDSLACYKMLAPAYPRCPSSNRELSIDKFKKLFERIRQVFCLVPTLYRKSSMDFAFDHLIYLTRDSCVVSRSLLQILYLPINSNQLICDDILQSIKNFCYPDILKSFKMPINQRRLAPSYSDIFVSQAICLLSHDFAKQPQNKSNIPLHNERLEYLDRFLTIAAPIFKQAYSLFCRNAARQQEKLHDFIISFQNLHSTAQTMDLVVDRTRDGTLYSWSKYYLMRFIIRYIDSGLELELFAPYEYPYVYWVLYSLYMELHDLISQAKKNVINKAYHEYQLVTCQAYGLMCAGMFAFTNGLKNRNLITKLNEEYVSEEIVFKYRFDLIQGSCIGSCTNTIYRLYKMEEKSDGSGFKSALQYFEAAKVVIETHMQNNDYEDLNMRQLSVESGKFNPLPNLELEMQQFSSCLRICKTNIVVLRLLLSDSLQNLDRSAESAKFDFSLHKSFPTVRVL